MKVKFTVITVCYNAVDVITETIKSLLSQKFSEYEYIIQDGGSTDGTLEEVRKLTGGRAGVSIYSETDAGIYDAMNKALVKAKGEYVFFLNAGDCLVNDAVLLRVNEYIGSHSADIVYGDIIQVQGEKRELRKYGRFCQSSIYFLMGACICHQAIFAKRELFDRKGFDITYQVCADREWLLFQKKNDAVFGVMSFTISEVLIEGFSSNHINELEQETEECLRKYYGRKSCIYILLLTIKKNGLIVKVLRRLERSFFVREE